jgi:hypothetical protein
LIANHLPFTIDPLQGNLKSFGAFPAVAADGGLVLVEFGGDVVTRSQPYQAIH